MEENKSSNVFKRLFPLAALMFGTYCGGAMASGTYATGYMATFGGGWMFVFIGIFFLFMSFFCAVALDFAHAYQTSDYNEYGLALYGLNKDNSNKALKFIVALYFDLFNLLMGGITAAATIALFGELFNQLFGIPVMVASLGAVVIFAFLTMYGAGFLRKFNTAMTISLIVSLGVILIAVINHRGGELANRIGNFDIGMDWSGTTLKAHMTMLIYYCFTTCNWGATLTNHTDVVKNRKECYLSGIMIGLVVSILFMITCFIVIPYLPEQMNATPILSICKDYLSPVLTIFYWIVVLISVISTGPTFAYNIANRFSKSWKNENISHKTKFFVISLAFLLLCYALSYMGLMAIAQKGYALMGKIAIPGLAIPLVISIFRVSKKRKAEKTQTI